MAASTVCSFTSFSFIKVWQVRIKRPVPKSMSGMLDCFFDSQPSMPPFAIPMIPTFATSPSSRAFVACVVLCAIKTTSSGSMLFLVRQFSKHSITPAATPISWSCVVMTTDSPIISWVSLSSATAFVCVPPTSMPTRIFLSPMLRRSPFLAWAGLFPVPKLGPPAVHARGGRAAYRIYSNIVANRPGSDISVWWQASGGCGLTVLIRT